MRLLLLPMILAVGMPTCSYFGGGGQPREPVQQAGQATQAAAAVPSGSASNGMFGFLPGGCPAITEATRVEVNNWIYTAIREEGMFSPPMPAGSSGLAPFLTLTSLTVTPSRTLHCGVYAQWTTSYRYHTITRTISGSADLPVDSGGHIDPSAMASLKTWTKMVDTNYWGPDLYAFSLETQKRLEAQ